MENRRISKHRQTKIELGRCDVLKRLRVLCPTGDQALYFMSLRRCLNNGENYHLYEHYKCIINVVCNLHCSATARYL